MSEHTVTEVQKYMNQLNEECRGGVTDEQIQADATYGIFKVLQVIAEQLARIADVMEECNP
jgi:hypothetical protein